MDTITQPIQQPAYQEQVPPPQVPQEQEVPKKGINKIIFIAGGLIVIVLLVAGGSFAYLNLSSQKPTQNTALNSYTNNQKQVQKEVENSAITDTSDTQISKDLETIDNILSSLDSGTAAVDQGFNDKAVNLQ